MPHLKILKYPLDPDLQGSLKPPFSIIHGPFGSGKSTLLVAMLHFFAQQMVNMPGSSSPRLLVTAHTNVAVDRILLGLLESGFTGTDTPFNSSCSAHCKSHRE